MKVPTSIAAAALLLFAGFAAPLPLAAAEEDMERVRKRVVVQGKPCPEPERPCVLAGTRFRVNELSFAGTREFKFDRGEDRSQPFYAVVLASGPLCGLTEDERVRAQALFPAHKVFLHRHLCEDFGDKVTYTGIDRKVGFLAVYAGESEPEAKAFLDQVRASGRFPGANLRRMQVVVTWQLE